MAARETTMFGTNFSKPSDVFGSVKRSLGRRPKCQCKHHQQKLLQKQEEQRQQLQAKLAQRGDKRAFNASRGKTNTTTILFGRNLLVIGDKLLKKTIFFYVRSYVAQFVNKNTIKYTQNCFQNREILA
jgi:hypothetical protein